MNNSTFLKYAADNCLTPVAWFGIYYPTYAVKVKYQYPTTDPADFRDRALLQLIDIGVSYSTACRLLMVNDPHQSILKRFKSDAPQLVHWDKAINRLALTPLGKQKVERVELAQNGVDCCFIDGFTGIPFPGDVVKNLSGRYDLKDVVNIPGGIYSFNPAIEQRISELNMHLRAGKAHKYLSRLRIHEKAKETSMTPLGPKWMTNLSMGIFLKDGEVVRRIFCDNAPAPVSPFGWLENPDRFRIKAGAKNGCFSMEYDTSENSDVFTQTTVTSLIGIIGSQLENRFGMELVKSGRLKVDTKTGCCILKVNSIAAGIKNRESLISAINRGLVSIQLKGMIGSLFVSLIPDSATSTLAKLRADIDNSQNPWEDIVARIKESLPDSWRQTLIAIGRHDLVFRHDISQYIKYGNDNNIL